MRCQGYLSGILSEPVAPVVTSRSTTCSWWDSVCRLIERVSETPSSIAWSRCSSENRRFNRFSKIFEYREDVDRLWLAVLEQLEVGFGQIGDRPAVAVVDDDADLDEPCRGAERRLILSGQNDEGARQNRRVDTHFLKMLFGIFTCTPSVWSTSCVIATSPATLVS
jgi:hypothetical protein